MGTPATWLLGKARATFIAHKTGRIPVKREARRQSRIDIAFKYMANARDVTSHIDACHAEIIRLGGVIPSWPQKGKTA